MSCLSTTTRRALVRNLQQPARCTFCAQTTTTRFSSHAASAARRTTTRQGHEQLRPSSFLLRRTRPFSTTGPPLPSKPPGDLSNFRSIVDNPPELVRSGSHSRHSVPGLLFLALIPVTALVLGTWQVQRLGWKTDLIAKLEDRILRDPLPLPPRIDPDVVVADFDYRRVLAEGRYRHDREMLVGPRMRDGEDGYMVVTPLERGGGGERGGGTVLVNRGWIAKRFRDQRDRPDSVKEGRDEEVVVEGLIREPWKKNMFTPENRPDKGEFYFPDVKQMAELTGSQPVWIEQTMEPDLLQVVDMQSRGIPIGRAPEVNLRNNHAQYIFTWYGLAFATSIMFYMVVKKPPTNIARRVRQNRDWS